MDNFPKYQYSKFIGQDQVVVRSNDRSEFEGMVEYVKNFGKDVTDSWKQSAAPTTPVQPAPGLVGALGTCPKCGAGNIIYKKSGKVGCGAYCWRK